MPAGLQATAARIDADITAVAIAIRDAMTQARNLNTQVNGGGNGTAFLQGIGHPDPAAALQFIGFLNTLAAVYFGAATQPAATDFDTDLAPVWAAQI